MVLTKGTARDDGMTPCQQLCLTKHSLTLVKGLYVPFSPATCLCHASYHFTFNFAIFLTLECWQQHQPCSLQTGSAQGHLCAVESGDSAEHSPLSSSNLVLDQSLRLRIRLKVLPKISSTGLLISMLLLQVWQPTHAQSGPLCYL